ncbi:hypothetical protein PI124_g808 [Phytophthora idaei]|nr:hypothetical protein PI125_g11063 [Phytophthora idaei]KAG3254687.1 hypothetical protein PI124_g808 [Phytophthora idaei]
MEKVDKRGRKHTDSFTTGKQVFLLTTGIRDPPVSNLGLGFLAPRGKACVNQGLIGPFTVTKVIGNAYTLDIPTSLRPHPTFSVGRLKQYRSSEIPSVATSASVSTTFLRDGLSLLIVALGAQRWIAERTVDHDTRPRRSTHGGQTRELPQGRTRGAINGTIACVGWDSPRLKTLGNRGVA